MKFEKVENLQRKIWSIQTAEGEHNFWNRLLLQPFSIRRITIKTGKNIWDLETYRKSEQIHYYYFLKNFRSYQTYKHQSCGQQQDFSGVWNRPDLFMGLDDEKGWAKVSNPKLFLLLKFIYSEKAAKFCEVFPLFLTTVHTVKSKVKILQNFAAFSEYMNFNKKNPIP